MVKSFALGADCIYSARAMMLSLGCIQAIRCNANVCPAGIATQDPALYKGLDVMDKWKRVKNFQSESVASVAELLGTIGLKHSNEVRPWHIQRRVDMQKSMHYGEIFNRVKKGCLLTDEIPKEFARAFAASSAESYEHQNVDF